MEKPHHGETKLIERKLNLLAKWICDHADFPYKTMGWCIIIVIYWFRITGDISSNQSRIRAWFFCRRKYSGWLDISDGQRLRSYTAPSSDDDEINATREAFTISFTNTVVPLGVAFPADAVLLRKTFFSFCGKQYLQIASISESAKVLPHVKSIFSDELCKEEINSRMGTCIANIAVDGNHVSSQSNTYSKVVHYAIDDHFLLSGFTALTSIDLGGLTGARTSSDTIYSEYTSLSSIDLGGLTCGNDIGDHFLTGCAALLQ